MPETVVIAQFQRRLVQLGCPSRRLREKVRELAEHHADLKLAALEQGLSEMEAGRRADALLGDPVLLAENAVTLLRQSSWWGRHPVIGFCILHQLGFVPAWAGCWAVLCALCWLLGRIFGPAYTIDHQLAGVFSDDPALFNGIVRPANVGLTLAATLVVVLVFCWMARSSAVGLKWMLTACAFCSLTCYFSLADIQPHNVTVGYGVGYWWRSPQWIYAVIPLLVAALIFLRQRRREASLVSVPMEQRSKCRRRAPRQSIFRTPTYWVVTVLALVLLQFVVAALADYSTDKTREAQIKAKVWPAERAATLALLKARQSATVPANAQTLDLKPWLNARLLDSTDGPADVKENNLAQLPSGVRAFGGIPFDVEGKIQLLGEPLPISQRKFPGRINAIPLNRKCARLHLLHGASALHSPGNKIARLVLHYSNGSSAHIEIVGGRHLLDWCGPIYNTDAGDGRNTTSPDSELAWAGSNPWISEHAPDFSLRLYKTTFANPHPELEITTLDYVSTLSGPAPFLLGLTTEPPSAP
jgi:hypothetical protein